jgi:hypothetical protein
VIDEPVKATWSDPPKIGGANTAFVDAWNILAKEASLFHYISKVDVFAGLGQFAVLLLGIDDGRTLDQPVRTSGKARKLLYIQPYLEGSVKVVEFDENTSSERFGRPVMYEVTPGQIQDTSQQQLTLPGKLFARRPIRVHWTRIFHLADNTLENPIFGHSRMEPIYNTLDDILKTVGGAAETYWMVANRGIQVDVDKDMTLAEDDADELADEVEEYQDGLRRFIRTRGVKIENLGSDPADPSKVFDAELSLLAAATGIPKRVLIGVEAGQLASQQDRANWAQVVAERVADFAEPIILVPLIMQLVSLGVLPPVERSELEINWPDAYKLSPLERAQTSAQMARSAANIAKAMDTARNAVGVPLLSVEEARTIISFGKHPPVFSGLPVGTTPPEAPPPDTTQENIVA